MNLTQTSLAEQALLNLKEKDLVYLHPNNNDILAYFGTYNKTKKVNEFEGNQLEFDCQISFRLNTDYHIWEPRFETRRIIYPVEDILNEKYSLAIGKSAILKLMKKQDNLNSGLVLRLIDLKL